MAAMLRMAPPCTHVARRFATTADAAFLRALFAESCDDLLVHPPDVRDLLLDMRYCGRRRQIDADHPRAVREVLVADGADAGILVVDWDETVVHVVDLVIADAQRHRGIASLALESVIAEAAPRPVRLELRSENASALALSQRLGFVARPTDAGHVAMERPAGRF